MRIVIVEDEIRIREGLAKLIRKIAPNYQVVGEAEDGLACIRIIEETRPDLVITDIRMPDMDGLAMLNRLKEKAVRARIIVLSAYSEFAYAREAIKIGVCEYLLKPINIADLTRSLKNAEEAISTERDSRAAGGSRSLESVLHSVLSGDGTITDDEEARMAERFLTDANGSCALVSLYLGDEYTTASIRAAGQAKSILFAGKLPDYRILELPKARKLAIFLFGFGEAEPLRLWFASVFVPELRRTGLKDFCCAWISFPGLPGLKTAMRRLDSCLDWNIVLGDGKLISCPDVERTRFVPLSYPMTMENQVRSALCAQNSDRFRSGIDDFLHYLHADTIRSPKEIKEALIRFFWAVLNAAREVAYDKYEGLAQQDILERITSAVTWSELESASAILMRLAPELPRGGQDDCYIINRTKNLVHEFYSRGITLEEIASMINVTPEYLSSQFRRGTGVNFSAYIKDYRMRRAKELLIGTELKLYSVAEKVGYADAKYFCRVFKESTGHSPSDYRRANK